MILEYLQLLFAFAICTILAMKIANNLNVYEEDLEYANQIDKLDRTKHDLLEKSANIRSKLQMKKMEILKIETQNHMDIQKLTEKYQCVFQDLAEIDKNQFYDLIKEKINDNH